MHTERIYLNHDLMRMIARSLHIQQGAKSMDLSNIISHMSVSVQLTAKGNDRLFCHLFSHYKENDTIKDFVVWVGEDFFGTHPSIIYRMTDAFLPGVMPVQGFRKAWEPKVGETDWKSGADMNVDEARYYGIKVTRYFDRVGSGPNTTIWVELNFD